MDGMPDVIHKGCGVVPSLAIPSWNSCIGIYRFGVRHYVYIHGHVNISYIRLMSLLFEHLGHLAGSTLLFVIVGTW